MNARTVGRLILVVALAAGIGLVIAYRHQIDAASIERWVAEFGAWGPIIFMAAFAAATTLALPGLIFTLAGGALFGPYWGPFLSVTGATIGSTVAFLIARYVAADWVAQRLGERLARLIEGVEAEGWRFVAFVRLVPLIPFNALNYALGLTRIRLSHYVLATYVCMIPAGIAYSYVGYAGREALAGGESSIQAGIIALALIAAVAFVPRLIRRLRGKTDAELTASETSADRGLYIDAK